MKNAYLPLIEIVYPRQLLSHSFRRLFCLTFLTLAVPLALLADTIGGGSVGQPAVGPDPAYDYGSDTQGYVLVKNWDFGTSGTVTDYATLDSEFNYHDQFLHYCIGGSKYGSQTVASSTSTSVPHNVHNFTQFTEADIAALNHDPIREFTSGAMMTYLRPLNDTQTTFNAGLYNSGNTVADLNSKVIGNGSFYAKLALDGGGEFLGQDIIWETRVRFKPVRYFWFALWTAGNPWVSANYPVIGGAEMDLVETFGYNNGSGNTNFDGHGFHSSLVGPGDFWNYAVGSWGQGMKNFDVIDDPSDPNDNYLPDDWSVEDWHIWTWVYKADNTWIAYLDGKPVNVGKAYWTAGGREKDMPVPMHFLFDAAWGHAELTNMQSGTITESELLEAYYEWDYSRIYLRNATVPTGPKNLSLGSYVWSATDGSTRLPLSNGFSSQLENKARAANILDGLPYTFWGATNGSYPQHVLVDLRGLKTITSFDLAPRNDRPYQYKIETSLDGEHFGVLVDESSNSLNGPFDHSVSPTLARYVKLTITGVYSGTFWAQITDFDIWGYDEDESEFLFPQSDNLDYAYNPSGHNGSAWESATETSPTRDWGGLSSGVTTVPVSSAVASITRAYDFSGGHGETGSFNFLDSDATFEFWIKPDSLSGGRQIIFETGGTWTGLSVTLHDDTIYFTAKTTGIGSGEPDIVLMSSPLSANDINDFIQIVATISDQSAELYVNPVGTAFPATPVDSTASVGSANWGGNNASGLGGAYPALGASSDDDDSVLWYKDDFGSFYGQFGLVRIYDDQLTAKEVASNYIADAFAPPPIQIQVGTVVTGQSTGSQWHTVNLEPGFIDPIVVMGPPSRDGLEPLNVRVRNVTTQSFEFQLDEWDYLTDNGYHGTESLDYVVIEAGIHELDGLLLEAGSIPAVGAKTTPLFKHDLSQYFSVKPQVFTQCVTSNNATALAPRLRSVSNDSFKIYLQEEKVADGVIPNDEEVHYIAWEEGYSSRYGILVEKVDGGVDHNATTHTYSESFSALPSLLAGMQTDNGIDVATLRKDNETTGSVVLRVEEEDSLGIGTNHNSESVGLLLFEHF